MSRPGDKGGMDTANTLPNVLGLLHHDGTPVTRESCLTCANNVARQAADYRQYIASLQGDDLGLPFIAQEIADMEKLATIAERSKAAWLALARVLEAKQ